jgi:hypothetical protein
MRKSKQYKDYIKEEIARCKANLLIHKDPVRRDIIQRHMFALKKTLKQGIPQGDNSVYAQVQDDDTVYYN